MFELSKEDELKLEKNLVWIFADRRSGTTWLGSQLLSHKTRYLDEPLIGLHLGIQKGDRNIDTRTISVQAKRENYFFSKQHKDSWVFFLRKLILNRIFNQFNTLSSTIIIKEPSGSFGSDIISQCLPNSKIILIFRDGRDIVDSKLDARTEGAWETERKIGHRLPPISEKKKTKSIKRMSLNWVNLMSILLAIQKNHSKDSCYSLKYEDLLQNTEIELTKIYQFLNLEITAEEIQKLIKKYAFENIPDRKKGKGKFHRFATPGLWEKNFSQEEKEIMNNLMKNTLTKLNYS